MAYEALETLQLTVDQILDHYITPVKQEILSIRLQSVVLQKNLKHYPYKQRIIDAANTTREIIEYYFFSEENHSDCGRTLRQLAENLKSTAGDVVDYVKRKDPANKVSPPTNSQAVSSSSSKDVVVGFDEDVKVIKDWLTLASVYRHLPDVGKGGIGKSRLQVLPIVGTGGIGKTTLAKLLYNDELIMQRFGIYAWVTLSHDYSVASVALNLLASMKGISEERDVEREIPMESLICKHLRGKKYLIVVDDVCSTKAWDDVKMLFPNCNSSSRIIVTTRLQDVAAYIASSSYIHTLRLLDEFDSWNLLKQKVFADEDCPLELEDLGKEIAKNCGGLPLSIVLVAGLLLKIHTPESWKQIAANGVQLETIIYSSYTHLEDDYKACFLYMAGFPEDYEIHVLELVNLWIAEGFFKSSLEEEAKNCIHDLVERSLVLVTSKKFDGKIKTCSLHDIVRDFCVRQAKKNKVILPVMDYLPTPILRRHFLPRLIKDHPCISATSYDLHLKDYVHSSHICTIICIPKKGYRCKGSLEKFSSLKILHVLGGNNHWDWEPGQVFNLIHLTYLACNIPTSIVPPAISKLQNLQTLIIYRSDVRLPVEIWRLRQLRHLIAFSFQPLPQPEGEALSLENLQTVSLAKDLVCSERMVEMIPNIKKLRLRYSEEEFDADYQLNNLKHLCRLEKLKSEAGGVFSFSLVEKSNLEMVRCFTFRRSINLAFPLLLKKLTLSCWRLPWTFMGIIGSLPNLQVLKLRNYAFEGEYWGTTEGEFGELRVLLIDISNLHDWRTESSHLPKLECLMLHSCQHLLEIPSSFGGIPTLEMIEVDYTGALFRSAQSIRQKQLQSGNSRFQVRVRQTRYDPFQWTNLEDLRVEDPQTRDDIHVEEGNPFGDITIRPRTRMMVSDF